MELKESCCVSRALRLRDIRKGEAVVSGGSCMGGSAEGSREKA